MISPPVTPRPKLPLRTVRDAYLAVITNFAQLLQISWLWALCLALLQLIVIWFSKRWLPEAPLFKGSHLRTRDIAAWAAFFPFYLLAAASIAVAWHRLLLQNERPLSHIYFRLDRLVWGYFAVALTISIPFLFIMSLSTLLLTFGSLVVIAPVAPVALSADTEYRLAMAAFAIIAPIAAVLTSWLWVVLPARALERTTGFGEAWRRTRSNRWRIAMGTLLTWAPPLLLSEVARRFGISHWVWVWDIMNMIVGMVLAVVYVGFLSYTYRHLLA